MTNTSLCTKCGALGASYRCSACKSVFYCSPECQKVHWKDHKGECKTLATKKSQELHGTLPCATTLSKSEINQIAPAIMELYKREYKWFTQVFPAENWDKNNGLREKIAKGGVGAMTAKMIPWTYKSCTAQVALVLAGANPCCCVSDPVCAEFGPAWGKQLFEPWLEDFKELLAPLKIQTLYNANDLQPTRGVVIYRESSSTQARDFEPVLSNPWTGVGALGQPSVERLRKIFGYPSHCGFLQIKVCLAFEHYFDITGEREPIVPSGVNMSGAELYTSQPIVAYSYYANEDSGADLQAAGLHYRRVSDTLGDFGLKTCLDLLCYEEPEEQFRMPIKYVALMQLAINNGRAPSKEKLNRDNFFRTYTNRFCKTASVIPSLMETFAKEWPETALFEKFPRFLQQGNDDLAGHLGGIELGRATEGSRFVSVRFQGEERANEGPRERGPRPRK